MKKIVSLSIFCFAILLFGGFGAAVRGQESAKANDTSLIPILGNYSNASISLGGSSTISPDTGASNIGTATISVSGNFKGAISVSPSSGAVRVLNAYPAGNYTVTVRAADFAGFSVTRSFTLTVTNISSCNTLDFAGIRATVGINPSGLVTADFNGDGRQDAATANQLSNNISVLLGNGAGSFGTVTNFALSNGANSPSSIAVGDFNGDNKADLAVGNLNGGIWQISVFIGTGTGNFAAPVNFASGSNAQITIIVVGDFNGDGRQDIAARNLSGALTIILRNTANNGFDAPTLISGAPVGSMAAADFNQDGRHDLAVGRGGQNVVTALIRNAANNDFDQVNLTINGSAQQIAVGDFTGDGRQDIAVSHSSGGVDVLPRNALGFDAPVFASASVSSPMEAGDFNTDGRLDLAFVSSNQPTILFRNAANTNFDSQFFVGTTLSLNRIAVADFTGDGRADIAGLNFVSGSPGGVLVVRRSGTNPNFDLSPTTTLGSNSFTDAALGDFDNDGRQDLATATNGTFSVAIQKGAGNGGFTNLTNAVLNNGNILSGTITAADFNNDGNTDLIVGNTSINGFSILNGAGNGSFAAAIDFPVGFAPIRFAVGDFNGDGRADFALNRQNSNQTLIYLRNTANSGFETAVTISHAASPNWLTVGDFNNDGNDDFAVGFFSTNNFAVILRNAGNSGFDVPVSYVTTNGNTQLTTADFDGDGNLDIAAAQNEISVYYGSATGVFGTPTSYGGSLTATYVESGDFNGDGRQDIVAAVSNYFGSNGRANVVVLLRNAAHNGFDPPAGFNGSYILNNSFTQKILVGEVNGDGRQDLLTSNGSSGGIQANFSIMPRVCTVDLNLLGALPNAAAGQNYSKTIYANGGIAPYNFTVSGLPNGLNFTTNADSVTIFGNPSIGGQFDVSINISDSNPFAETNIAPNVANSLTQILPLRVAFVPTAANVSVSGRVLTANGRTVHSAIITLTDQNGNTRTARSSSFGNFRFEEVEAGQLYIISVSSKHHQFAPQVIAVNEEITDLNLTANE